MGSDTASTYHVNHWVADFNTRNWHVMKVLKDTRKNNTGEIIGDVLLESHIAALVVSKIVP